MNVLRVTLGLGALLLLGMMAPVHAEPWVVYQPGQGDGSELGHGRHIVLVSGDEEYRSEEALPQLGKILSQRHGFKCTVLFAIDPKTGAINPNQNDNIPGLEALKSADLMILFTRFRKLPDEQMQYIADYVDSGKPIVALRTSTHAFANAGSKKFGKYDWQSKEWPQGFGREVLGETWISHHGHHGVQSTRGIFAPGAEENPILRGIKSGDIWGPTDVYGVRLPLPGDSKPLVLGQILVGMKPEDKALEGPKNEPMMPVAWTKSYKSASGKPSRIFTTTMGASQDLQNEAVRRMLVNASLWALGLEEKIPAKTNVELVGDYKPTAFKFNGHKVGVMPADHELK